MAQKERVIFRPFGLTKTTIKNEPVGVFSSVFSYGKLREMFSIFVGSHLAIVESNDQMHESTFSYY